jgi:hypothetical protein
MLHSSATMQLSLKLLNSKPIGPLWMQSKVREPCMPDVPIGKNPDPCRDVACYVWSALARRNAFLRPGPANSPPSVGVSKQAARLQHDQNPSAPRRRCVELSSWCRDVACYVWSALARRRKYFCVINPQRTTEIWTGTLGDKTHFATNCRDTFRKSR